ncbi:hypothetical protein M231_00682 [Tremella mesenterica]|uniref:Uncharacterized protein n=1 Tax=Tremella mesenterica TaxID=5217 RepID=A0A4Q1BUY9_TREME|nr:hypothetical protein M231_00682 [Tremella mesenterica]
MQQLLNPFAQKYPENTDTALPTQATSVRFNRYGPYAGHYLACGCGDGTVEVWDMETKGVIKTLEGHVKPVGGVAWSRNNRYLLTSSLDSTAIIWDLSFLPNPLLQPYTPYTSGKTASITSSNSSQRVRTIRFDAPVAQAVFHPRNSKIVLASLTCNEVVLVDLRSGGGRWKLSDVMEGGGEGEMEVDGAEVKGKKSALTCAAWSPCGSRIYAGTTGGLLLVIDPLSRYVMNRIRVANSGIKQLTFDAMGRNIILSSTDRALRTLSVDSRTGALAPVHRFQDLINRTPWHAIAFSGDAEYVMGGAGHKMAHNVFIWDRDSGSLVKVLEGPREPLVDCDWHPTRPVIASVSTLGEIHLWQTSSPDNWAAFAPGFEELEENVEYDEREDEFDIEDESDLLRRKDAEEDVVIDVLSPSDDYPRRPENIPTSRSPSRAVKTEQMEDEGEEEREAIRLAQAVKEWADNDPDDDTWEGFHMSLDLLTETEITVLSS